MSTEECDIVELEDFNGVKLPSSFSQIKEKIADLDVKNDDVWITAFPKSGSTWCQELVWLLGNNLNYEGAKTTQEIRIPFLEANSFHPAFEIFQQKHKIPNRNSKPLPDFIKLINDQTNRRFIKSHLPWDFLPRQIIDGVKTPKIIHIIRHPKQVAVSYFYHSLNIFRFYVGNLDDFIERFIGGNVMFGDYFNNILSYWKRRHLPNLLILTYEEMSSNLPGVIDKVSNFLRKSYGEEEIKELMNYLSFDKMKKNNAVNKQAFITNPEIQFMRKGTVDSYKEDLTPEMSTKLDKWIDDMTKGTGLPYEKFV